MTFLLRFAGFIFCGYFSGPERAINKAVAPPFSPAKVTGEDERTLIYLSQTNENKGVIIKAIFKSGGNKLACSTSSSQIAATNTQHPETLLFQTMRLIFAPKPVLAAQGYSRIVGGKAFIDSPPLAKRNKNWRLKLIQIP
ncbi:unnamed protein product [Leptidea sinapis]|uniref:Uncharacterized protein n=1 Tax=Leptidea sinapis TaxID=189913 RepID=A0A5E4PTI0_9NEOP|nr:unnamed protein product [Leptidea sinapis]